MLDYTGVKCPVCGLPFAEDDDIVVCPVCGAPYHRDCYTKEGRCIFEDLHDQGKDWEPPAVPLTPDVSAEIKDQECPVCGTLNSHSSLFCNRCGAALLGEPQTHNNLPRQDANSSGPAFNAMPNTPPVGGTMPPFAYDPMGGVSPAEMLDENVSFGDTSKLVKVNTGYYMPVFRYMKTTGRNKFNFCAFFFSGAWMLFRKQYKWGSVVMTAMALLYLGYLSSSVFISNPLLMELMNRAGIDLSLGVSPTNEQLMVLSHLLAENPGQEILIFLPILCLVAMLIIMIVVGLRGNKMYMKHCVRTVRQVKELQQRVDSDPTGDTYMTLSEKGGVNVAVAISIGVCYFLVSNFLPLIL